MVGRYSFNARVFFNGSFCDTNHFEDDASVGHLHLVRSGPVVFSGPSFPRRAGASGWRRH
jgi:hypothetical protein